jgi:hypothetical protein
MTQPTLLIVGDSWGCGEWTHSGDHQLVVNHPGMEEYLGKHFKIVNLSRGYASNWQTCYALWNYLNTRVNDSELKILVLQTDAFRSALHERYHIDLDGIYSQSKNLFHFYEQLIELFYFKLNGIAQQFNTSICLSGGFTDLHTGILPNFDKLVPVCTSWINLLDQRHIPSIIPLRIDPKFFVTAKQHNRHDLCKQIADYSEQHFLELQEMLETNLFGPAHGDFHPSRLGHEVFANHILNRV